MNLLYEKVQHLQFGIGEITQQSPITITVYFSKPHGEKRFLYPDAFESYLAPCNTLLLQQIKDELSSRRAQMATERKQKLEHMEKEKLELLETQRVVTKENRKSLTKKSVAPRKSIAGTKKR